MHVQITIVGIHLKCLLHRLFYNRLNTINKQEVFSLFYLQHSHKEGRLTENKNVIISLNMYDFNLVFLFTIYLK
jgi:hypothetical protein